MRHINIIILFLSILFLPQNLFSIDVRQDVVNKTLKRLDKEVANRETYLNIRQHKIDSLKRSLSHQNDSLSYISTLMAIGDEYIAFNNDSALSYFNKGQSIAKNNSYDSIAIVLSLKRATYLPLAGFLHDAITGYESIDSLSIPPGLHEFYYESGKQMYSYLASFFTSYPSINKVWSQKSVEAQKNLISILNPNSTKYKLYLGEYFIDTKQYTKAKAILTNALETIDESNNLYARASHGLATIAAHENNTNESIYYLALSSISDIKSATLEITSMQELGEILLQQKDIDRAHKYSSIALANAVRCKASMRIIHSSEAMAVIQESHNAEIENWQKLMIIFNISIIILAIILVIVLIYLRHEMNRLNHLREKLQRANNTKEVYISQFLSLCSIYMDKLNQFSNIVNRKLSAGKADDLLKIIQSGKFIEEQSREFYDVFDDAFLNLYPSFISEVNKLLLPDKQIILKSEEKMNTDLRILALMRLGIEDGSHIAQMLNYSVNTIYAYRNKLKNRAINRDNFELDIMKIKSIS